MQKFTRKEIMGYLNKVIIKETNIPSDAIEDYKSKISDIIIELQDEVFSTFPEGDEVTQDKIVKFLDKSQVKSEETKKVLMDSAAYLTVEIPIIIPIEVIAMCLMLNKLVILYNITKLSELFSNEIINHVVSVSILETQEELILLDLLKKADTTKIN